MTDERKALYPKSYGSWAGNEAGHKPDYDRCCESVWDNHRSYQCSRKASAGPHKAYCATHDPKAKELREAKSRETYLRKQREWALGGYGSVLAKALKAIEDGHNDPRSLAKETLDRLRERDWWKE